MAHDISSHTLLIAGPKPPTEVTVPQSCTALALGGLEIEAQGGLLRDLSIQSISFADTDYHAGFAMAETDAGFAVSSSRPEWCDHHW